MKFAYTLAGLTAGLAVLASGAHAAVYTVEALDHSANGGAGTGLSTLTFVAGEEFTLSADVDDLWNAGALPRWSNADGLTGPRFATGTDESMFDPSRFINASGTSFSGPAWASGTLVLYYWDTFTADNTHSVDVTISTVPEPATWAIMIAGFGLAGGALRRRRLATA